MPQLFEEALLRDFDFAMFDLYMPGECGHGAAQCFQRRFPDKAVVVLMMEDEAEAPRNAINLNVEAVLSKRDRIDLIPVAIAAAMARRSCG